jgi:spermidine synthase
MINRRLFLLAQAALLVGALTARAQTKVLYEKQSPYNSILVTEDEQGLRTLFFEKGGARQSVVKVGDPDHLELSYARTMLAGLAFASKTDRVLIVGLGGGTIPGFLHRHYPDMTIEAVDIDPDVVDVAKKFFGFREDAKMRAHVQDGRRFVEERQGLYDIIFLDAFGSDNIPYHLSTREFLLAVRRALTPPGIAVGNIWSRGSNPLYDSMVRTYQDVFESLYILDVRGSGNKILIALPRKDSDRRLDFLRRARAISTEKRFPFDMGDAIEYGYEFMGEKNESGQVLTDQSKPQKDKGAADYTARAWKGPIRW